MQRQVYLDNLKVLLIAAIIALHAILGYAATIDVWPYASVREVTLWPPAEAVLFAVAAPFAFFVIALLFLVAGPVLLFPTIESILIVFGSVWLLAAAQQRLDRKPRLGPALSRSAYGAFIVQAPILFGLAVALRPIDVPAELKAIIVAGAGVAASFTLAWLLISRVPGVARIL